MSGIYRTGCNLCRNKWYVFFFILYTCFSPQIELSTITWTLRTQPIIFGEDVILYCDPGTSFSQKKQRKFKLGSKLLTFDEGPSDRNKYGGKLEEKGFTLIIKHFQESDFRKNYTCVYGFEQYRANLNTTNYQWNPGPDTYEVDFNSSLLQLDVYIKFQKIFPVPKCEILFGDNMKNTTASKNATSVVDKYFLTSTMILEYQYSWNECGEFNVSIICNFGKQPETLETFLISRRCLGTDNGVNSGASDATMIIVVVIIVTLFGASILASLYKKKWSPSKCLHARNESNVVNFKKGKENNKNIASGSASVEFPLI